MALLFLAPLIATALLLASYLLRELSHEALKGSAYECGFIPTEGQTFSPFAVTFFVVGILFLLFDLELLLMFPLVLAQGGWALLGASLFFVFLVLSLAYEIGIDIVRASVSC